MTGVNVIMNRAEPALYYYDCPIRIPADFPYTYIPQDNAAFLLFVAAMMFPRGSVRCAGRSRILSRRLQREVECFGCDRLILMTTGKHGACGAVLHYANSAHFICAVWRLSKSCRP
jgi:hypothetical protein